MLNFKIVKNYVDAFYTTSLQQKDKAYEECMRWEEIMKKNPLITQYLSNSTIDTDRKKNIFQGVIPSYFITKQLFDIVIENNRGEYWEKIIKIYIQKYKYEEGIVDVKITSSVKLETKEITKIETFIKKKYNYKKINIFNEVDKDIIGGVIVSFDGIQIDYSLKTILQKIKV